MNRLQQLNEFGQSVWLDYIHRELISSGKLQRLIQEDGLRGLTSNPAIFEKAITGGQEYRDTLRALRQKGFGPQEQYEALAVRDIQDAADVLRSVHEETGTVDGYVSLEVSPLLALNTQGTLNEARRLWQAVARPNLMIKVPGTAEGIPAIRDLIAEGINVNVTLIFDPAVYEQIALAYVSGLESAAAQGRDLTRIASVASFFISRVDTAVDAQLEARAKAASDPTEQKRLRGLTGKAAIATAKLAYEHYQRLTSSDRWKRLATAGAHPQRLLWASTSTKNPAYRDVMYVEELIGPETVNTMPPATLDAFRDHGRVRASLVEGQPQARAVLEELEQLGIGITGVAAQLVRDGVRLFEEPFEKLLGALESATRSEGAPAGAPR
jgi:transaldolase/glucose-6-phosphate isomerase